MANFAQIAIDKIKSVASSLGKTYTDYSNSYINNVAKPGANLAGQMFNPVVNTISQGAQAGARLQSNFNPLVQFATPQANRLQAGVTSNYLSTQARPDLLAAGKGIAGR